MTKHNLTKSMRGLSPKHPTMNFLTLTALMIMKRRLQSCALLAEASLAEVRRTAAADQSPIMPRNLNKNIS